MLKNNLFSLVKLILSCLILFLIGDVVAELLASAIIYFKKVFSRSVGAMFLTLSSDQGMSAALF